MSEKSDLDEGLPYRECRPSKLVTMTAQGVAWQNPDNVLANFPITGVPNPAPHMNDDPEIVGNLGAQLIGELSQRAMTPAQQATADARHRTWQNLDTVRANVYVAGATDPAPDPRDEYLKMLTIEFEAYRRRMEEAVALASELMAEVRDLRAKLAARDGIPPNALRFGR